MRNSDAVASKSTYASFRNKAGIILLILLVGEFFNVRTKLADYGKVPETFYNNTGKAQVVRAPGNLPSKPIPPWNVTSYFLSDEFISQFRLPERRPPNDHQTTRPTFTVQDPSGINHQFSQFRYYMYTNETISQKEAMRSSLESGEWPNKKSVDHLVTDRQAEQDLIETLELHPWRTLDPNEADLFFVTTPLTWLTGRSQAGRAIYSALEALSQDPHFQQGHRHIVLSLHWAMFGPHYISKYRRFREAHKLIKSVTLVKGYNSELLPRILTPLLERKKLNGEEMYLRGFEKKLSKPSYTCCGFSLGLWSMDLPLQRDSYEKWVHRKTLFFYHTREKPSASNSTIYRQLPLQTFRGTNLPENWSIGYDIPPDDYRRTLLDSKYCLVIRGDTPSSHALIRALRVGCLPVVISDFLPIFSPSLSATLDVRNFCIFVDEEEYITNVAAVFQRIAALETEHPDYLRLKYEHLHWAQRVLFPDVDDSLIVPAMLREASTVVKW